MDNRDTVSSGPIPPLTITKGEMDHILKTLSRMDFAERNKIETDTAMAADREQAALMAPLMFGIEGVGVASSYWAIFGIFRKMVEMGIIRCK